MLKACRATKYLLVALALFGCSGGGGGDTGGNTRQDAMSTGGSAGQDAKGTDASGSGAGGSFGLDAPVADSNGGGAGGTVGIDATAAGGGGAGGAVGIDAPVADGNGGGAGGAVGIDAPVADGNGGGAGGGVGTDAPVAGDGGGGAGGAVGIDAPVADGSGGGAGGTGGIAITGGTTTTGGSTLTGGTGGAANSTRFPIATTSENEISLGAAFDGTNYLVEILGSQNSSSNMTAQLVSGSTGSLVGSRILIGPLSADSPQPSGIAFDGTNYLVIWRDPITNNIYGRLISKAGQLVGSSFFIGQPGGKAARLIFDGTNYLVVWDTRSGVENTSDIYAQFVTPSGTLLGSPITMAAAMNSQRQPVVALGSTNILVAWVDGRRGNGVVDGCGPIDYDNDIYGQFVAKSGASTPGALIGGNFAINNDSSPSDSTILAAASDGANYLVLWPDRMLSSSGQTLSTCIDGVEKFGPSEIHGQMVTAAGAALGGVISVGSGNQNFPSVVFDGTKYLVAWSDIRNDVNKNYVCDSNEGTCLDIYGQYVSTSGLVAGGEFSIIADAGDQLGGVAGFNGGRYLILYYEASSSGATDADVYGMFMNP